MKLCKACYKSPIIGKSPFAKYCLSCRIKINKDKQKIRSYKWWKLNPKKVRDNNRKQMLLKPWLKSYWAAWTRCTNPKNNKNWKYYGGKGIKLLMNKEDFKFLWFRDKAYLLKDPTIDRIKDSGNYTLKNCRFIERKENTLRRRCNNV
jgi:hypothetical protein